MKAFLWRMLSIIRFKLFGSWPTAIR